MWPEVQGCGTPLHSPESWECHHTVSLLPPPPPALSRGAVITGPLPVPVQKSNDGRRSQHGDWGLRLRRLFVAHQAARPETCCTAPAATSQFVRGCMVPEAFGLHTATYNLQRPATPRQRRVGRTRFFSAIIFHRYQIIARGICRGRCSQGQQAAWPRRHRTGVRNEINSNNYIFYSSIALWESSTRLFTHKLVIAQSTVMGDILCFLGWKSLGNTRVRIMVGCLHVLRALLRHKQWRSQRGNKQNRVGRTRFFSTISSLPESSPGEFVGAAVHRESKQPGRGATQSSPPDWCSEWD